MRIVIQRVKRAKVTCENCNNSLNNSVNNDDDIEKDIINVNDVCSNSQEVASKPFNEISKGIVAYVGFSKDITEDKVEKAVSKLLNLRIFKMNNELCSLKDLNYELLIISNFTLQGIQKGRRINYKNCLEALKASHYYELLLNKLKENYDSSKIKNGFFQKMMEVEVALDGPFNFVLDL